MRNLTDVSTTAYAILQQDSNSLQIEHQDLCLPRRAKKVATALALLPVSSTAHKCVPVRMNATTCDRLRSGEDAPYQKKQAPVQFGETGAAPVLFFIKTNSLSGSTMYRYLFFCDFRFSFLPLSSISASPNSKELLIGNRRSVVAKPAEHSRHRGLFVPALP
jgi:hypothetical protein